MDNAGRFARFCIVGGAGFLVDAGILQILHTLGMSPIAARLVSFPAAVAVTWYLNRHFTFGAHSPTGGAQAKYFLGQVLGALINLGVFAAALRMVPELRGYPVVALAFGAAVALLFNFLWSQTFVFRVGRT